MSEISRYPAVQQINFYIVTNGAKLIHPSG